MEVNFDVHIDLTVLRRIWPYSTQSQAKTLAGKNVSEMIYFVSSGTYNIRRSRVTQNSIQSWSNCHRWNNKRSGKH